MDEVDIFRKFLVPLAEYSQLEELENAVHAALADQLEEDFEAGDQEHFWIRIDFPQLKGRSLYGDFESGMTPILSRYLSNQPSAWQPNDIAVHWYGEGVCVDFWMGPADLLSIIH